MDIAKPFVISKDLVMEAYKGVKANAGSAGIDGQTIGNFEMNLIDNLYCLWNRMSSGSYFPKPIKAVSIPKKDGGERILGVPTVTDRIAQRVVELTLGPKLEAIFLPNSYAYRPGKSALDAVGVTRMRVWQYDWVLEFDIKGLFDNIDHELLMRAVRKHTDSKWGILYIERWLKAPLQGPDGTFTERTKGIPQGSGISPLLSNLFMHYVFDAWMERRYPNSPWCRYSDDGLVHCKTEKEAETILAMLQLRFKECRLELHPTKTRIVYCKDGKRRGKSKHMKFDFLGFTFQGRTLKNRKEDTLFQGFVPAASQSSLRSMREKTRKAGFRNRTDMSLEEISKIYNPVLRGWMNYYGRYSPTIMYPALRHFNKTVEMWARSKYKRLKRHKIRAGCYLQKIAKEHPYLFIRWQKGIIQSFV